MSTRATTAAALGEQIRLAHQLADAWAVSDIECNSVSTELDGARWHDTRPMTDPREHAPEVVDMATAALAYARLRGLVQAHPQHAHLVRITTRR